MNYKEIDMANFCFNLSKQSEDIKNTLIFLGVPTITACYFVMKLIKEMIKNV